MKKKPTRTDKLAALCHRHLGRFLSAYKVQEVSPLGRTQEVSRVRQRGYVLDHQKRKRKDGVLEHGYLVVSVGER